MVLSPLDCQSVRIAAPVNQFRAELVPILGLSRPESVPNRRPDSPLCSLPNRTPGKISWQWNSLSA